MSKRNDSIDATKRLFYVMVINPDYSKYPVHTGISYKEAKHMAVEMGLHCTVKRRRFAVGYGNSKVEID